MIAHQNVIVQSLQILQITPDDHEKVLSVLPLFHITGLVHGLHFPIIINAEVIMMQEFTMEVMLKTVTEHKISELLLVPPIIIRLVRDAEVDKYDLSCIKRFSSGAAPLSDEIIQLLKNKFPNTGFKQGYGMTESCSCITVHPPGFYDFKYAHSVGTIVANTEIKIIKDDGTEANINEPGEILARGPQVVMGYLNNDEATEHTFDKNGFLHTGDQGYIDDEGVVRIVDRLKEMIKVKGVGIAPAEIEDLLLGHPKVDDVAVIAIADEYTGERPMAYIVPKPGIKESQQLGKELIQYVEEKRARDKWVKQIEFVDTIPKSASGKILRRVLRDRRKSGKHGQVVTADNKKKSML